MMMFGGRHLPAREVMLSNRSQKEIIVKKDDEEKENIDDNDIILDGSDLFDTPY